MANTIILLYLILSIAIVLTLILKFKLNAAIAMFVGALFMGIVSGNGMTATVSTIGKGFANTLQSIGISIGFGIMLGQLIADAGAVQTISNALLKTFGKDRGDYALGTSGFIVSVPVFFDVGLVIMIPLAKQLAKENTKKALPYFVSALMCGLSFAHTFVPPTPGPITCAAIMNISLGTMILFGILVGLPAFFISVFLYQKLVLRRKNYWNPQTDEMHDPVKEAEAQKRADALMRNPEKLPSLFESLFPILLPIVLILLNTVWRAVVGVDAKGVSRVPQFIQLIGGREVAMLLGLFAAMFICRRKDRMSSNKIADSITSAIGSCGTVLLITGLGGGFGAVLQSTGVGIVLQGMLESVHIPVILFVWMLAAVLKFAQGSGTVAMITALEIAAAMTITVNPVLVALAGMSGSLMGAHVNDSGFWVTANIAGLTTKGGLKIYTVICAIMSLVSLSLILLLRIFI